MNASSFEPLDQALLRAIAAGDTQFHALSMAVSAIAEPLAKPDRWGVRSTDRLVDRRLQALRRRGAIAYGAGHWRVTAAA